MKWIRHNLTYVIVALIAILLILFTVQLQYLLLDIQPDQPANNVAQAVTATPFATPRLLQPTVLPQAAVVELSSPTPLPGANTETSSGAGNAANPAQQQPAAAVALSPEELLEIDILSAPNLTTSEDDTLLVEFIKSNPHAVGFIRYSSYLTNQDSLRTVKIQTANAVIEPNEDTVASGAYPFSRPLLLYTSAADLKAKPHLEGYLGCYLNQLFTEVETAGYTQPSLAMYRDALDTFKAVCQRCQMVGSNNPLFPEVPACTVADSLPVRLDITGGSTVYPLSERMKTIYQQAGFTGEITVEDVGTSGGVERFCEKGEADLVGASRLVKEKEEQQCQAINRKLVTFPVGLDLVVVVVSRQNTFVEQLSFAQLRLLFTKAMRWSEINPAWVGDTIVRAIPNKSRGTFTFFVEMLYAGSSASVAVAQAQPGPALPTVAQLRPSPTAMPALPTVPPATNTPAQRADFRIGYLERDATCTLTTEIVQLILEQAWGYRVERVAFTTTSELFTALTGALSSRIDWTMCYSTLTDQRELAEKSTLLSLIGEGYSTSYGIVSSRAMQRVLQQELPCVYTLLKNFKLTDADLRTASAANWVADHQALLQTWTSCR